MKTASVGKVYPSPGKEDSAKIMVLLMQNQMFQRMRRGNHVFLTWKRN